MGSDTTGTEWEHCNACLRTTRHEVVASRTVTEPEYVENEYYIEWTIASTLLECRGCGSVSLRRRTVCEQIGYDDTKFFPPPVSRQLPRWHLKLPEDLGALVGEVYVALNAGCSRLAAMGARSIVDILMTKTVGSEGGFAERLDRLVKQGFLSARNRGTIESALDAGHAAVHRGYVPKKDEIGIVLDIVENLLQSVLLEKDAEELTRKTPRRE